MHITDRFFLLLLTNLFATIASPIRDSIPGYDEPFSIVARGSPHFTALELRAQAGTLYTSSPQSSTCANNIVEETATFIRRHDTSLDLYTPTNLIQQLWVDTLGLAGFSDGDGTGPTGADYGPWFVDETNGQVSFNGKVPFACPVSGPAQYSVWFFEAGNAKDGCFVVYLYAYSTPGRPRCEYQTAQES